MHGLSKKVFRVNFCFIGSKDKQSSFLTEKTFNESGSKKKSRVTASHFSASHNFWRLDFRPNNNYLFSQISLRKSLGRLPSAGTLKHYIWEITETGGSIAQWLANLLPNIAAPGMISSIAKKMSMLPRLTKGTAHRGKWTVNYPAHFWRNLVLNMISSSWKWINQSVNWLYKISRILLHHL